MEVAFVISEEQSIFKVLSKTVELLEGNTAAISQNYYGCLFHELLAFQLADRRRHSEVCLHFSCYLQHGSMSSFNSGKVNLVLLGQLLTPHKASKKKNLLVR